MKQYLDTFEKIKKNFVDTYNMFYGDAKASLELKGDDVLDAEILIKKDLIIYGTFAIDELDVDFVKQNFDDTEKSSLAYQIGFKYFIRIFIPIPRGW